MKILFVENRYKTAFLLPITKKLEEEGHEIHWIVQNKQFTPNEKNVYVLDYPKKDNYPEKKEQYIDDIIYSDRKINYFGYKNKNYFYYYDQKIEELVNRINPDIAFGESTLFHELLIGHHCKNKGVFYLNPLPCRYPTGRFSFYTYDTLTPHEGSGEELPDEKAKAIISQIVNREVSPDYMKPLEVSKAEKIYDKFKILSGYYKGEKFNTPSPFQKLAIEKKRKASIAQWDAIAQHDLNTGEKFKILYPMQVQPEENIDVWGRKRRNQLTVIKEIVEYSNDDVELYIKPNPKPKYEIDFEFIEFCKKTEKVKMLHHSVKMSDIFSSFDLIVTVTGTVALECILSNKPVINLIETLNNTTANCIYLDHLKELPLWIDKVKQGKFPTIEEKDKVKFINLLNKTSYPGIISDPFCDKNCIKEENIDLVTKAFKKVLEGVKN